MSYQTPITIREVIDQMDRRRFLLPAIQRELVWSTEQIEVFFDSLMQDYPIGTFLFWDIEDRNLMQEYKYYEFIRKYHVKESAHNPVANVNGFNSITAVLDGQQRLSSLFIGIKGTFAYKLPRMRWDNPLAFPERQLYLNILSSAPDSDESNNEGVEYNFKFLTIPQLQSANNSTHYWFPVTNILNFNQEYEVNQFLVNNISNSSLYTPLQKQYASEVLNKLFWLIHRKPTIVYYKETTKSVDKCLNIFVRINSGGTKLDYSDLLLSTATAEWKRVNAREEINQLVDSINSYGNGFSFNKDFVLKSCLYNCDIDPAFKLVNFNPINMLKIETNWERISDSIRESVILLSELGFNRETLTSNNAILPITYFLFKHKLKASVLSNEQKKIIRKWLLMAILKRTFSGQPDNVLRPIRNVIQDGVDALFPFEGIIEAFKGKPKSMSFTKDDIDSLFDYEYGKSYTFATLALLYPNFNFKNSFHQDHIFPKKFFKTNILKREGVSENVSKYYLDNYNCIGNLQLIEGRENLVDV